MLQNIAGAVRRAARVLNPVTVSVICGVAVLPDLISRVIDVVQQQSKGRASGCEVSVLSRMIDTERMEDLPRIVRRIRAYSPCRATMGSRRDA